MKGPFFIRWKDGNYEPAEICANCGWYGSDQSCCMTKCPFIGYSEEDGDEDGEDDAE